MTNVPSKLCACARAHKPWDERTQETWSTHKIKVDLFRFSQRLYMPLFAAALITATLFMLASKGHTPVSLELSSQNSLPISLATIISSWPMSCTGFRLLLAFSIKTCSWFLVLKINLKNISLIVGPLSWNDLPPTIHRKILIGVPPIFSCYLQTFSWATTLRELLMS